MKSGNTKPEWVEVIVADTEQPSNGHVTDGEAEQEPASPIGNLYIEYGALRMTADGWYPVESLTQLLREMCSAC